MLGMEEEHRRARGCGPWNGVLLDVWKAVTRNDTLLSSGNFSVHI